MDNPPTLRTALDEVCARGAGFKRIAKILRFVDHQSVFELHNADHVGRSPVIGQVVLGRPQITAPHDPLDREPLFVRLSSPALPNVAPAVDALTGLRVIEHGGFVVDLATPPRRDHVFRGDVYLLTANNTFSAAAMFAAYFKCNRLGVIVGEEPGQTTNFVADAVPFTMPNSGLAFKVSFSEIHMPCEQSYYHGIQPDVPVAPSPQDIAVGKDVVLDAALARIGRNEPTR